MLFLYHDIKTTIIRKDPRSPFSVTKVAQNIKYSIVALFSLIFIILDHFFAQKRGSGVLPDDGVDIVV